MNGQIIPKFMLILDQWFSASELLTIWVRWFFWCGAWLMHHRMLSSISGLHPLHACMHAKSLQSCPTLCDRMDCSPAGSSFHGILQARILEWIAMPSSRGSFWTRNLTYVSYTAGGFSITEPPGKPHPLHAPSQLWQTKVSLFIAKCLLRQNCPWLRTTVLGLWTHSVLEIYLVINDNILERHHNKMSF